MVILHKKYTEKAQASEKEPKSIMSKFPEPVRSSFNEAQIKAIINISKENDWKRHPIDIRFTIPFFAKRFYIVFIAGKSRRDNKRPKNKIMHKIEVFLLSIFFTALLLLVITLLYIIKSALGLDIFPDMSLGIWNGIENWFESLVE